MCNLYSMTKYKEAIARLFRFGHNRAAEVDPLPAISLDTLHPSSVKPPPANLNWCRCRGVSCCRKRARRRVTNVRDDKILTSTFWRSSFEEHRCLLRAR